MLKHYNIFSISSPKKILLTNQRDSIQPLRVAYWTRRPFLTNFLHTFFACLLYTTSFFQSSNPTKVCKWNVCVKHYPKKNTCILYPSRILAYYAEHHYFPSSSQNQTTKTFSVSLFSLTQAYLQSPPLYSREEHVNSRKNWTASSPILQIPWKS